MKLVRVQCDDSVQHFSFRATSSDVFAAAAIELCTRLWVELEQLSATLETDDAHALRSRMATRLEVLRLEMILILERCTDQSEVLVEIPVIAAH